MTAIALAALARVLGRPVEARPDTPLTALGFDADCWPPLARALAEADPNLAALGDADAHGVRTLGDLVNAIEQRRTP